jgi:hypothetical protein
MFLLIREIILRRNNSIRPAFLQFDRQLKVGSSAGRSGVAFTRTYSELGPELCPRKSYMFDFPRAGHREPDKTVHTMVPSIGPSVVGCSYRVNMVLDSSHSIGLSDGHELQAFFSFIKLQAFAVNAQATCIPNDQNTQHVTMAGCEQYHASTVHSP